MKTYIKTFAIILTLTLLCACTSEVKQTSTSSVESDAPVTALSEEEISSEEENTKIVITDYLKTEDWKDYELIEIKDKTSPDYHIKPFSWTDSPDKQISVRSEMIFSGLHYLYFNMNNQMYKTVRKNSCDREQWIDNDFVIYTVENYPPEIMSLNHKKYIDILTLVGLENNTNGRYNFFLYTEENEIEIAFKSNDDIDAKYEDVGIVKYAVENGELVVRSSTINIGNKISSSDSQKENDSCEEQTNSNITIRDFVGEEIIITDYTKEEKWEDYSLSLIDEKEIYPYENWTEEYIYWATSPNNKINIKGESTNGYGNHVLYFNQDGEFYKSSRPHICSKVKWINDDYVLYNVYLGEPEIMNVKTKKHIGLISLLKLFKYNELTEYNYELSSNNIKLFDAFELVYIGNIDFAIEDEKFVVKKATIKKDKVNLEEYKNKEEPTLFDFEQKTTDIDLTQCETIIPIAEKMRNIKQCGNWTYFIYDIVLEEFDFVYPALYRKKSNEDIAYRISSIACHNEYDVFNDNVFYIDSSTSGKEHGILYRISVDGNKETSLMNELRTFRIVDGYIYYFHSFNTVGVGLGGYALYRMNLDGSDRMIAMYDATGSDIEYGYGEFEIKDGYYYEGNYRMKLGAPATGLERLEFLEDIDREWTYYITNQLIKARPDGLEKYVLDTPAYYYCFNKLEGDWIYYTKYGMQYIIKNDGSNKMRV